MSEPYFTDLTDGQWDRVRSAAFPHAADPLPLRAVVNGLLFRERAWLPWSLLPNGLAERYKAWDADGTWAKVRRAAADPPAQPPIAPRRSLARRALFPLRKVVHLARRVRARFSPVAQLPELFREAHDLAFAGNHAAAEQRLTHILELDPTNALTRIRRGLSRSALGRHAEAVTDGMVALSSPAVAIDSRIAANELLALAHLRLGDVGRSVGHGYVAKLLLRFGEFAPWRQDELAEEPDEFELLAAAHNELAETAINDHSDYAAADDLYRRRDALRERYREWLATVPARTLYLTEDWVRNVGHTAIIEVWLKMRHLRWHAWDRTVLIAPPRATANRALVNCYEPFVKVISDPAGGGASRHLAAALGPRVASDLVLPGGERKYFLEGMGAVQEAWEREGRGPLLRLGDEDAALGRATLREMGVPDGAWFVGLHVRSPGFHKEGELPHHANRNADITTYLPAIREVVRRGGWVVRLGDASMPPLPPTPGLIDYAVGPHKSDRMDVFLCAAARFFVGVASGLAHVPTAFGVPCLLTNWSSNAFPVYGRHDLFVPKLVRSAAGVLSFDEWLAPAVRSHCGRLTEMTAAGLTPIDNTPDELAEAVGEMTDRLDGRAVYTPDDEARVATFDATARRHGLVGFSRIGRDFVRRHANLLGEVAPRRAA